ncbi:transglycosylase SLT domain-containing protein [Tateyamaria sp. Alg231-49]|uniref:transglycosylase SLT domain-containing protein n=1 Tax=Tateyamaria sp. Alg231-49 TaxID=1922219 RepID=UPI001F2B17C0|nr:transglycosylase SLT domain-containing protein [Tateyamaria sp. Alg231-49]
MPFAGHEANGPFIVARMFLSRALFVICTAVGAVSVSVPSIVRAEASVQAADGLQSEVETMTSDAQPGLADVRPRLREHDMPATRWSGKQDHMLWNHAALSALKTHAVALVEEVPKDIGAWCPLYPDATDEQRRSFWLGFMSALAKFESTYNQRAVGGGGKWFGLLQISPATARGYGCNAGSGSALKSGAANLSCAARIMAVTVPRDGVIYAPGGRGVAADWGPMRSRSKRTDMAGWLRRQSYCTPLATTRPVLRPVRLASD